MSQLYNGDLHLLSELSWTAEPELRFSGTAALLPVVQLAVHRDLQAEPWLSPCGRCGRESNVYQGDPTQSPACSPTAKSSRECNDLYVAMQANQMQGPLGAVVQQMMNPVITNLDTGQIVTNNSVTTQYLCGLDAISNPPPQGWDGDYFSDEACSNATVYSSNSTLRIRVNSQAVPGHYKFTGSFQGEVNGQNAGNPVNITYNFTILPTASFTATPPSSFPAIPGRSTWESNMVNTTAGR